MIQAECLEMELIVAESQGGYVRVLQNVQHTIIKWLGGGAGQTGKSTMLQSGITFFILKWKEIDAFDEYEAKRIFEKEIKRMQSKTSRTVEKLLQT